jgi:hypothetical protein
MFAYAQVTTRTRDSAGVRIVEHRNVPSAQWTLGARPLVRIGTSDGTDQAVQFTRVTMGTRLSNGNVIVVDGTETRWFDSTGRLLRTITRNGDGPGEFRYINTVFRIAGDSIVVGGGPAYRQKQATFSPDGQLAREESMDFPKMQGLLRIAEGAFTVLPDRSWLITTQVPGKVPPPDPGPGMFRHYTQLTRVPRTLDAFFPLGLQGGIEQFGVRLNSDRTTFFLHPFYSRSFYASGGASLRIASALNPDYDIEVWRPNGTLERRIRRLDGRAAPTASQKNEAAQSMAKRPGGDRVPTPDSLPALGGLTLTADGYIVATRFTPATPPAEQRTLDVFDTEGRFVALLRLPWRFRPLEIGKDYILGVMFDDDDVPFVEVRRLVRP